MTNEEKVNNYWEYSRNKLKSFKKYYSKLDKQTQDKIQDIFNSVDIEYNQLSNNISNTLKNKLDRKIEEWKEKDLYKGYFKYKLDALYKKNISHRNYIEIMLFGTLYEEKKNVDEYVNILFKNVSTKYYNKGREDLKMKTKSMIPQVIFLAILDKEINNLNWNDYLEGLYITKEQQLTRQYTNSLQTNKKPNIEDKAFQNAISKLNNQLLSINNNKYSGGLDEYVSAYSNISYLEAGGTNNHKVVFISDHCDNTTKMCEEMDGLIFNTKDRNVFKRWYGDTQKDLVFMNIDVMGLVMGINQPPITNHFHWCHSMLEYINDDDDKTKLSLNKDKENTTIIKEYIENIKTSQIKLKIEEYKKDIVGKDIEYAYVILPNGDVYKYTGTEKSVNIDNMNGAIVLHNHPIDYDIYRSFGEDDYMALKNDNIKELLLTNPDYDYSIIKLKDFDDISYNEIYRKAMLKFDYTDTFEIQHEAMKILAERGYVKYERRIR